MDKLPIYEFKYRPRLWNKLKFWIWFTTPLGDIIHTIKSFEYIPRSDYYRKRGVFTFMTWYKNLPRTRFYL